MRVLSFHISCIVWCKWRAVTGLTWMTNGRIFSKTSRRNRKVQLAFFSVVWYYSLGVFDQELFIVLHFTFIIIRNDKRETWGIKLSKNTTLTIVCVLIQKLRRSTFSSKACNVYFKQTHDRFVLGGETGMKNWLKTITAFFRDKPKPRLGLLGKWYRLPGKDA